MWSNYEVLNYLQVNSYGLNPLCAMGKRKEEENGIRGCDYRGAAGAAMHQILKIDLMHPLKLNLMREISESCWSCS